MAAAIFSEQELYDMHRAKRLQAKNWTEIIDDDDLLDKYDRLNDSEKKDLEKALIKSVKNTKGLYGLAPRKVNTEEAYEEHQEIQGQIKEEAVVALSEFLKED